MFCHEHKRQQYWGLPDILVHWGWGSLISSPLRPSWQLDSLAGGCLNPAHMGHLTVIKSCGIKPLQPERLKLINSLVFAPSQRQTQTGVIKFEIILRVTYK